MVKRKKRKKKPYSPDARIRSALRRIWMWSPLPRTAKLNARIGLDTYLCAICTKVFSSKKVAVDHINPVVLIGEKSSDDWHKFITNLFCDPSALQILCKECHDKKTAKEHAQRQAT